MSACIRDGCERPRQTKDGRCRACYQRDRRRQDPDIAARDRARSQAWKDQHREANRKRDRDQKRAKFTCAGCGAPRRTLDTPCYLCTAEARRRTLIEMYEAGVPLKQVAAALGSTVNSLNRQLSALRQEGRVGYRYRGWEDRVAA